jgi:hypothetical protein
VAQAPGILMERWLLAEAKHTVTLYYALEPASES